ncbi:MAG: hypothetical protein M4579_002040 [Chaenotheca gracillima]|nr:MAG: hypothetical protein M4579_002040 [Chaenotheca gracillima]
MSASDADSLEIKRFEVSEVFCPDNPQVDIVFVHGLNGHPKDTWTAKNGVFWPAELLPKTLNAVNARILVYGYNADVYAFGGKSATRDYIHEHAQTLVTTLDAERFNEDATERPIIWVAHSLGGILVKRALDYAASISTINNQHLRSIFVSTYGIIFLGTPHNGADPAKWGKMLQSMCGTLLPKKVLDTEPQLVETLKTQSETLQNINLAFVNIMDKFHMSFFHEAEKTNLGITKDFIVDQTSAGPILPGLSYAGIEATHSAMCKFASKNSPGYTGVSSTLKRYSGDAPSTISKRWPEELANRERAKKYQASELLGFSGVEQLGSALNRPSGPSQNTSSTSVPSIDQSIPSLPLQIVPSPAAGSKTPLPLDTDDIRSEHTEPLLILPPSFPENAIFVGMKQELIEIDEKFTAMRHSRRGTVCVLLCSISGSGKSHLARQYAHTNRRRYPGGIFWVRAKSQAEIAQGYWDIAQKAALKDMHDPQDAETFIRTVKSWFESRQGWLLIFDGITVNRDEDLIAFQDVLPDGEGGSVIFTSVDRSLENRHLLLNPVLIRVRPLGDDEARRLLFKELHIDSPSRRDMEKATELVRKVERLPMAIHAIGSRLRDTQEPLVKYHIRAYSSDPKLQEPFKEIMEILEQLKHIEALCLINILCFFGQHVPFEMVQLGTRRIPPFTLELRARDTGSNSRDINTTIKILLKYALIERNDPDDQDVRGSHESFAKVIDILKMHSVVQTFCLELLKSTGEFALWLGRAVRFWSYSFEEADRRIKSKDGSGLVQDYREYEIHGNRLMEHVKKHQGKMSGLDVVLFDLEKILGKVKDEIQKRTPGSSQEAIDGQITHVSIFDRTSSTSDTGPDTPGVDRPHLYTWLDSDRMHSASPTTFGPHSPLPKSIAHGPRAFPASLYQEETGYTSDNDEPQPSVKMSQSQSQSTVRPPTSASTAGEWKEVKRKPRSNANLKKDPHVHRTVSLRKFHRDKGTNGGWRHIKPALPKPRVSLETAPGSVARQENSTSNKMSNRDARSALERLQPRGPVGNDEKPTSFSYADALVGRGPAQPAGNAGGFPISTVDPGVGLPLGQDRPGNSVSTRTGTREPTPQRVVPTFPQTLVAQSVPPQADGLPRPPTMQRLHSSHSSPGLRYTTALWSNGSNIYGDLAQNENFSPAPYPQTPPVMGPNPNALPYENISGTPKRALPHEFQDHGGFEDGPHGYSMPISPLDSMGFEHERSIPPYQDPRGAIYMPDQQMQSFTSQPGSQAMSRNASGQSASTAVSITHTEPVRPTPRFSPLPESTPPPSLARDRFRDGAPLRKSPKLGPLMPIPQNVAVPSPDPTISRFSDSSDQAFTAMGGWASSPNDSAAADAMSRSSSGPGIATQGTFVQFGDQPPVDLGLANMRAAQQRRENLQRAIDNGEFRIGPNAAINAAASTAAADDPRWAAYSYGQPGVGGQPAPSSTRNIPIMPYNIAQARRRQAEGRPNPPGEGQPASPTIQFPMSPRQIDLARRRRAVSNPRQPGEGFGLGLR